MPMIFQGKIRILAEMSPAIRAINIWILNELPDGRVFQAQTDGIVFAPSKEEAVDFPNYSLKYDEAQTLFDDLYRAGLRPTDAKDIDAVIEAVRAHNEDLRMMLLSFLQPKDD